MPRESLRIFITASDEPVVLNQFIGAIIEAKASQIVGLAVINPKRPRWNVIQKRKPSARKSQPTAGSGQGLPVIHFFRRVLEACRNIFIIVLIFGFFATVYQALRVLAFKLGIFAARIIPGYRSPSIQAVAARFGVPVWEFSGVNDATLLSRMRELKPHVVINQAPGILKEEFLGVPSIAVLNRHNALLPRNRGRLSPFWTIYKGEKAAGVSIHFVVRELDAGPIVVQREIPIAPGESANSLAQKCYAVAPATMIEALDTLERGDYQLIPNPESEATYNSNPDLGDALNYRWIRIKQFWARVAGR